MAILKRFEIWLLFGLVAVAIYFALHAEDPNAVESKIAAGTHSTSTEEIKGPAATHSDSPNESITPSQPTENLILQKVEISSRTQQGIVVDLTLFGRAKGDAPLDLRQRDAVTVSTSAGEIVEPFFLPFGEPLILDPEEDTLVQLQYWLSDLDIESLEIEIQEQKLIAQLPRKTESS